MSKVIDARAVTAEDETGAVFDKIAKKINGMTKGGERLRRREGATGGRQRLDRSWSTGLGRNFQNEIDAMALGSRQLAKVQRDWENFHAAMAKGPVRFANYARAIDEWKSSTLGGGVGGAAYMGAAAIKGGVKASADRAREFAPYDLGGMSEAERAEAMAKADEISSKYPSVSRTEALPHIRQLRSRL
jgi:hypothetical protein